MHLQNKNSLYLKILTRTYYILNKNTFKQP